MSVLIAVDGGASKTDLALLTGDGELLSLARGPLSSPHYLGLDGSLNVLEKLLDQASDEAKLARGTGPVADLAELLMAGVDFPVRGPRAARGGRGAWLVRAHDRRQRHVRGAASRH